MKRSRWGDGQVRERLEQLRATGFRPKEIDGYFEGLIGCSGPAAEGALKELVEHMDDDQLNRRTHEYVMGSWPPSQQDLVSKHVLVTHSLMESHGMSVTTTPDKWWVVLPDLSELTKAFDESDPRARGRAICRLALLGVLLIRMRKAEGREV